MRIASFVAGLVATLGGTVLIAAGWHAKYDAVVQAGGATIVAGLALAGASAGISTWRDERRLAVEKERQESTGQLVYQLLARFAGVPWDPKVETELRSRVAVWGDVQVVEKLRAWNATFDKHVQSGNPPGGTVVLSDAASAEFRRATAEVAQAVRRQFDPRDKVSVTQLENALFNIPPLGD